MEVTNRIKHNQSLPEEEHEESETWMISFADMLSLILGFFIIFFSIIGTKKQEQVNVDFLNIRHEINIKDLKKTILEKTKEITPIFPPDQDQEIEVVQKQKKLIVKFKNISFFDLGQTDVNQQGRAALKIFSKKFKEFQKDYTLMVQSFTDRKKVSPTNPRYQSNLELSALRSIGVMRALKDEGIEYNSMRIAGVGELKKTVSQQSNGQLSLGDLDSLSRTVILIIERNEDEK